MKVESLVEQGLESITKVLSGGSVAASISKPISLCMNAGVLSYLQLHPTHRKHIDDLLASVMRLIETMQHHYPKMAEMVVDLTPDNFTVFIKMATKVLRKKSTANIIQQYLEIYGDIFHHPQRIKAIGAYMVCVLSNLDEKYKAAVVAVIELAFTFIQIVSHTDLKTKVTEMSQSVHKYVMRPMYKELARKK